MMVGDQIEMFLDELAEIERSARETDTYGWDQLNRWRNRVTQYLNKIAPQEVEALATPDLFTDLFDEIERCRNYLISLKKDVAKYPNIFSNIQQSFEIAHPTKEVSKVELWLNRLKNHPIISVIIFMGIVITAIANFTSALQVIENFIKLVVKLK